MRSLARGAAGLLAVAAAAAQAPVAPWPDGLVTFARVAAGSEADPALLRSLREIGVRGLLLRPGQDPQVAQRLGFVWCGDGLAGDDLLRVPADEFAALRASYEHERAAAGLQPRRCLCEPSTRGELLQRVTTATDAAAPLAPRGLVLADQVSTTHAIAPLDLSFSPAALRECRTWLQVRYADVGALDRAWQTSFGAFDRVLPFTVDQMQERAAVLGDLLPASLAAWADHRTFMDGVLESSVRTLLGCVRSKLAVPCGLTGLLPPAAYGGMDYARVMPCLDLFEVADVGGARDLGMVLARDGACQLRRIDPAGAGEPAQVVLAQVADALAHGMAGVLIEDAETLVARDADEVQPSSFGIALRAALAQADRLAPFAAARLRRSAVWIVESQASVQALWFLDSTAAGPAWVRRTSRDEVARSTSLAVRASWVRLLEDLGLQPSFVVADALATGLRREPPQLLVLASCVALADSAAAAIVDYVDKGGVVVADGMLGLYDERLVRRARPALDDLFGLAPRTVGRRADFAVRQGRVDESARLPSGAAAYEQDVGAAVCERAGARTSVQCERRHGRGLAVYLNLAVCEYDGVRLDPQRLAVARDLRRRVQRVLDAAAVAPPVLVRGRGLPTCIERMLLTGGSGRQLLGVRVNALARPRILQELAQRTDNKITIQFARPVQLQLLDEPTPRGPSATFELGFDPWRGVFAEVIQR